MIITVAMLAYVAAQMNAAGKTFEKSYVVEGRIPLETLVEMGFPRLRPGEKILCGL